ncbi:hypothetical protein TWF696_002752 [Orbilia brochopaga]|uniref:CMP/dCMP-type deaminase domain-containing protein n=1 Tax=Orbilia brochopaga TaxID=3140254 RepID=A0AAV9U2K2_9PEZI
MDSPSASNSLAQDSAIVSASNDPKYFMQRALDEARKCTPSLSAFSVGAVLVDLATKKVVATGFSREREGNTHAEEVCFIKFDEDEQALSHQSGGQYALYTTMEPCTERLSGKKPCLDRIIQFGRISTVYVGCKEPSTFIAENTATKRLPDNGIQYLSVDGMGPECLEVAKMGH